MDKETGVGVGGGEGMMEYYSAIKKGIIATCGNTDGPWEP